MKENLNELALFAGAGGGILGGKLLGWKTVCAVEIEEYPISVLIQRQNEGILTPFPIWDNIRTFNGKPWKGIVDVVSGGFPCQDISAAGTGKGIEGEKSGLWKEMARVICEVLPKYTFIENSPLLTIRGLSTVLCSLAQMGYNAKWGVFSGENVGAATKRERMFILGMRESIRCKNFKNEKINPVNIEICWNGGHSTRKDDEKAWLMDHSFISRRPNDLAEWMDRFKAIGNGQIPAVAVLAWKILHGEKEKIKS